ncbi:uncharacterized protein LOC143190795 [Rhynchophorus ferrugineus]|uniref:uncharacterized protein LOC143190795 n=1 Tax=Rhynchophorus ferrugineus TaxID=354439 RepID=UPI003FCE55F0
MTYFTLLDEIWIFQNGTLDHSWQDDSKGSVDNKYQCVVIGSMNLVCSHCKALKYKKEANGLCCANGKVKLIPLDPPPEPLYSLVSGIGTDSIHFLTHIQQYNNCFQMTSFGATNAVRENFMPTFKIQGQIYHRAGSLLPVSDSDNKFLQIYFMGNSPQEIDLRCAHNNLVKRSIVEQLQTLFHQHNQLIILFKTALDLMPSDNHKIVIRADKTPAGQHTRRFNAPTIDEIAIVVVGENSESRDISQCRKEEEELVEGAIINYDNPSRNPGFLSPQNISLARSRSDISK